MKLAFLTATFPSLTETFVFREWNYLRQDTGLEVNVFSIRKPKGSWRMELPDHVEVEVQYLSPNHVFGILWTCIWFPLRSPLCMFRALRMLMKELLLHPIRRAPTLVFQMISGVYLGTYLKRYKFDVIHGHFSSASSIALFAHLSSGIPFSYTVYANDDLFTAPVAFFEAKVRWCRNVVTDTEYNRRMINLLTNFRYEEKVKVIYTGLDLETFSEVRPKSAFNTPLRLLSVGSMSGFKGYPTVLEALKQVKENGIDFEYHIIGGGDAAVPEQLIKRYGLGDAVKLLGAQDFENVRSEFEWCDAFIMVSEINAGGRRDGFPTVIVEAMLFQRLVIATYISDIPNNVKNHETGLMVAEKSPNQLTETIEYVASHPDECRTMVENAHRMAVEKFDAKINYESLAELLKSGGLDGKEGF